MFAFGVKGISFRWISLISERFDFKNVTTERLKERNKVRSTTMLT